MKKITLVFLILIFSDLNGNAQLMQEWVARYNGVNSQIDIAHSLAIDNVRNVYVTGESNVRSDDFDYATIKYNSSGSLQWIAFTMEQVIPTMLQMILQLII